MAGSSSRQNGMKGGRPVGSTTKPRLSDYLSKKDINVLVKKAYSMAKSGNEMMLKFVLEQNFGKAIQPTELDMKGNVTITFDNSFNEPASKTTPNSTE